MPYVQRKDGAIVAYYPNRQPGYAEEFIAENVAEFVAHLADDAYRNSREYQPED